MMRPVTLMPLKLQATLNGWRLYAARQLDPKFKVYQEKVLLRDQYRCQFCGFQARQYQDVVNQDGDFSNNKLSNLVTACCFCAQCFFVESVGAGGYGGGVLMYLPELTQAQLSGICHVLFCAMTNNTGYKNTAQLIYRAFKTRTQEVEAKFGEGFSDPALLGQMIIDMGVSATEMKQIFKDICLLPSRAKFRIQIEHWAANALRATQKKSA